MTDDPDINDTLCIDGEDAVRARSDSAKRYNGGNIETALAYVDLTIDPIPPREWIVPERVPRGSVTLLSGEGAVGKSLLLLQLSAAIALGRDWIGTLPVSGPVLYVNCEDDDAEVCRRLEAISVYYGVARNEIAKQLHVLSFVGRDPLLGLADRAGLIKPTPLFDQVRREAVRLRPQLIIIDPVADVFAGNENDRSQTRQFIGLARDLALEADAGVILASHPSLTGIQSDSGISGNTAWHNSVRARAYFKTPEKAEPDVRELEWKKSNYGPIKESTMLYWRNGVYVPVARAGSLEQLAADTKIDHLFLDLLRQLTGQGRNVTDKRCATYAPTILADQPEAKRDKVSKKQLVDAMTRLFAAGKIIVITEGPQSRQRTRIVEKRGER